MSYADGLITTGEEVVHREKQHWWVFVWGARFTILAVVIAIAFFFLGGALSPDGVSGTFRMVLGWVTAVMFIGGLGLLFWTTLRYLNLEYVVTTRRVIQVEGVINKRAADSSLEKINDAVLEQSVFGRALGFGDLRILTASEAAISDFRMLMRPVAFKKAMLEAKHDYEMELGGEPDGAPPSPPLRMVPTERPQAAEGSTPSPPTAQPPGAAAEASPAIAAPAAATPPSEDSEELTRALATLADLRDRGAVTAEEYEAKKADILRRL